MDDQVNGMKRRFGFDFVDRIHSGMNLVEKDTVLSRFKNGRLKILYVAPERLQQKSFQLELKRLIEKGININYFPIDEAHCISEWGHDFRPSYSKMKQRQTDLPHVNGNYPSLIALTATASTKVQDDVLDQLKLNKEKDVIHRIIDRKELSLEVITTKLDTTQSSYSIDYRDPKDTTKILTVNFEPDHTKYDILKYILDEVLPNRFDEFDIKTDSGLIFTVYADPQPAIDIAQRIIQQNQNNHIKEGSTQFNNLVKAIFNSDGCKESEGAAGLSKYLNEIGMESLPWYAQPGYRRSITPNDRNKMGIKWEKTKYETQEKYINNEVNLLVSTKGFGMGIDKPNIRYIIHYGFPGSLESYFQQIGRAGRDNKHAHCILIWDSPTQECYDDLKTKPVPKCFEYDQTTKKYSFKECPYERTKRCDYAKQVYFIETGYPTPYELQCSIDYLKDRAAKENTGSWVYFKSKYLRDSVASTLGYVQSQISQINERLIIEKLFTLGYIADYSETNLKLSIERLATMKHIFDSTNNYLIKEHIEYLEIVYPGFLNAAPGANSTEFDVVNYILQLKVNPKITNEVTIEEVVQFFNILNEREDIKIRRYDYGYEIRLNQKMFSTRIADAKDFQKVNAWKESQYGMLNNIATYADLKPVDQNHQESEVSCRRAHIMAVFGTQSGAIGGNVRCDFCDNCGYHSKWHQHANDIVADMTEQNFRKDVREFLLMQSNNVNHLLEKLDLFFSLVSTMKENNFSKLAEITCQNWMETVGGSQNQANILLLSLSYYIQNNQDLYQRYLGEFFDLVIDNEISRLIVKNIIAMFDIDPSEIYSMHFKNEDKLNAFRIFKGINTDLENIIGLELTTSATASWQNANKQLRRLEYNG